MHNPENHPRDVTSGGLVHSLGDPKMEKHGEDAGILIAAMIDHVCFIQCHGETRL